MSLGAKGVRVIFRRGGRREAARCGACKHYDGNHGYCLRNFITVHEGALACRYFARAQVR